MQPHATTCSTCGAIPAHRGYRLPGLLSSLPESRRAYRWACSRPECIADAEGRWRKAKGERDADQGE